MKTFVLLLALIAFCSGAVSGEINRSQSQKRAFWRQTGYPHGRPGYVVDHIHPLACGGPDRPWNMQWQSAREAKAKDRWELNCPEWSTFSW